MNNMTTLNWCLALLTCFTSVGFTAAGDVPENPTRNLYYGETHMHTAYSLGAFIGGTTPKHPNFFAGEETIRSAWQINIDAAEEHNNPGLFTAFIAYEWSAAPQGGNLHRNVLFRGAKAPEIPMSYIDINREEGLWSWMAGLEKKGIQSLAIPHNSNASKGMMFNDNDSSGNPIDLATATYRNTIGAAELATVWTDPEFDTAELALYYVRTLEIPTPRWSTYDAVRAALPLPEDTAAVIQERAWSSPIWYRPQ